MRRRRVAHHDVHKLYKAYHLEKEHAPLIWLEGNKHTGFYNYYELLFVLAVFNFRSL
jgi:hypothetical protein